MGILTPEEMYKIVDLFMSHDERQSVLKCMANGNNEGAIRIMERHYNWWRNRMDKQKFAKLSKGEF